MGWGAVVRRPVALVAALVLVVEALGIAWLNWFLGLVAENQQMSLAGVDPRAMTVGSWVAGGLFGLYLLWCGAVLLRTGLRDRAPGNAGRLLLISAAVVHGLLGAFTVGLVGWTAFAFLMVVFGLIVLTLVAYGTEPGTRDTDFADGAPNAGPPPAVNSPNPA